ncbi:Arc family DNA-binding protein [Limimaricola sp.]
MKIRVPQDVKAWIEKQAEQNSSSQSSEIVRAIRERAARIEREMPA